MELGNSLTIQDRTSKMTMQAREILEADTKPGDDEVSHDDVLRYALEHRDELEANYQERKD